MKVWTVIKQTIGEAASDHIGQKAAALAYYGLLSLAPLLIVAIAVAGILLGPREARKSVLREVRSVLGREADDPIESAIENLTPHEGNVTALAVAGGILFIAASGVFAQLQMSMNDIWGIQPKKRNFAWGIVRKRLLSFVLVLIAAGLMIALLIVNTIITVLDTWISARIGLPPWFWIGVEFGVALVLMTLLTAMVFKILPDARVYWRDVWLGAFVSSLLFNLGRSAVGWYLSQSSRISAYGAAGAVLIILTWLWFSGLVLVFGAEVTQVVARVHGRKIESRHEPEEDERG